MNEPVDGCESGVEFTGVSSDRPTSFSSTEDRDGLPDLRERLAQPDSIDETELIELLCSDQVHRWRGGERIPAEAYLALHPTLHGQSEAAFELIYGEYLVRESLGESPKLKEFLWRFPGFADRLRRQLSLHQALDEGAARTELGAGSEGDLADGPSVPVLPGFEILGELGRGGMSVVYLARQVGLNRLVALKVIRAKVYADADIAARFRDEAEAAARFQHPNLIQVYEVGEFEGQGFLVLEYAAGGTLQQKLGGTPQVPRDAAQLVEYLARAVHYAHQRGIVHRDLKPANVVLTEDGVPKVTDFGLAKLLEREAGLTRTGDIMGTPSYMAPEQARGTPADVTAAADIYALGAILYEMLTGRPPFKGATPLSTLAQVAGQEPLPPGRLHRHLPREIETICLKCLEKDPRKRYATASDLADDLRRFLEDRPILARRISRAELVWRWCRREPVKAGLTFTLLFVLITGFVAVFSQWRRAEEKARAESMARDQAELAEERARVNLYSSQIAQARLEWRLNNLLGAEQILSECEPQRRGWEWNYLRNLNQSPLLTVALPELGFVMGVVFSPDGKRFALSGFNPYQDPGLPDIYPVEIWDTASQQRLQSLVGPGITLRLAFSPDGRLISASGTGGVKLWETATGNEIRSWNAGGTATFSPDGKVIACGSGRSVSFWDVATGSKIREFPSSSGRVTYRPDGQVLAVSGPLAVELRDAATGHEIRHLPHGPGEPEDRLVRFFTDEGPDLAFSPDGRHLVVATNPPRVWDTTTGQPLFQLSGHAGTVPGVAISPDGRQVATAGVDSTIRLWDVATGAERSVLRGHSAWVGCVAFHPDGWCLASGGRQVAEFKLWDLTRHQEYLSLPHSPVAMIFDEDGQHLSVVTLAGRIRTLETESGRTRVGPHVDLTQEWLTPASLAEFSPDGQRLATIGSDRTLGKVWDPETGRALVTLTGLAAPASHLAWSLAGERIAAAGIARRDPKPFREVKVWDAETNQVLCSFTPSHSPTRFLHGRVALSPDGRRVAFDDYQESSPPPAAGHATMIVRICEVLGGRELLNLPLGSSPLYCLAFSPDGKAIASCDEDGILSMRDTQSGSVLWKAKGPRAIYRLAFSPDGHRLAGADRESVGMWDARDGQQLLILRGAPPRPFDGGFNPTLAWSPDGRQLASLNWDGSISIWNGSELPITPADRWRMATSRVFGWHLSEGEAALAGNQVDAAVFHLAALRGLEPPGSWSGRRRGRLSLRLGQWETAREDFARWLASGEPDEGEAWLSYARLLLMSKDGPRYRQLCARMLAAFEQDTQDSVPLYAARTLALAPCSALEADRLLRLLPVERLARAGMPHELFGLALALYRAARWEPARAALEESAKRDPSAAWRVGPLLAMIHHRLGRTLEARNDLAEARGRFERHRTEDQKSSRPLFDGEWFDYEVLYREASSLIGAGER